MFFSNIGKSTSQHGAHSQVSKSRSFATRSRNAAALRDLVAKDLDLLTCEWAPCWLVDFPMFEKNKSGELTPLHHPFTAPNCTVDELKDDPLGALTEAYDIVLNGTELSTI